MTKEKIQSLLIYLAKLEQSLNSSIPLKHATRSKTYKTYLKHEISMVKAKLEAAKLEGDA